jgi:hypothetical protein
MLNERREKVSFSISEIFPNASQGLSNVGFLFGAGTSYKAGYPLMPELTIRVLEKLDPNEISIIETIIEKQLNIKLDKSRGEPNIEVISDTIESGIYTVNPSEDLYKKLINLRKIIREQIVEILLENKRPFLDDHIRFLNALKSVYMGRAESIWIFTTNYDMLFEVAASVIKIPICNGFIGTSFSYFNIQCLQMNSGIILGNRFSPFTQPVVRLIKLHGSLDWWKDNSSIYNTLIPGHINDSLERLMVLPRKKKITETLDSPFGELFRFSERIIGSACKYIVSCGFSFGDEHINETLLLPKLQQGKIKLTAFIKSDNTNLESFKQCASFSYGTQSICKKLNVYESTGSELWQFDKLVDLICKYSGVGGC